MPRLRIPRTRLLVGHNLPVSEYKQKISELAELMEEYRLGEAQLQTEEIRIAFRRRPTARTVTTESNASHEIEFSQEPLAAEEPLAAPVQAGTPITSPMNGIFYGSPSPASSPFVKEGETVQAGQVIGLIEAMKVFNEIPSTVSGVVLKLVAETGAIVQPGDVLLYIG